MIWIFISDTILKPSVWTDIDIDNRLVEKQTTRLLLKAVELFFKNHSHCEAAVTLQALSLNSGFCLMTGARQRTLPLVGNKLDLGRSP